MKETRFKDTEVGKIPEEWNTVNIYNICSIKARIGWQGLKSDEYLDSGEYILVTGSDFKNGYVDWETCHYVTGWRYNQDKNIQIKKGDVLITKDGTIGKVAYLDNIPMNGTLNSGVFVIRPNADSVNQEYLSWLFKSIWFTTFIDQLSVGSTINHLYQKDFVKFKLVIPQNILEQTRIASALTSVDNLLTSLGKLIEKRRAVKQGAMQMLLTGKKRLKGFDGPWVDMQLKNGLKFQCGAPFQSEWFNDDRIGIRLIKNRDLKSEDQLYYYNGNYSDEYIVKNGDLLIGMDGDFLPCLWEKGLALLNQRVGRIQTNIWDIKFLYYILFNPLKQKQEGTGATTVKHLAHGDVESMIVYMPTDVKEQSAIASVLTSMDNEITALEAKKKKYEAIKQGMMQQLLTGRIRLVD